MKNEEIISRLPLFASLDGKEIQLLARLFIEENYKKGEYIFWENDDSEWFYVVSKGMVRILKHSADGKEIILEIVPPSEMFGAVAVLDRKPYPASAQAMDDTVVIKISRKNLFAVMDRFPSVALDVVSAMGKRLRDAHDMMKALAIERVERRIASILLKLSERVGLPEGRGIRIDIKLTRQDIAEMVGTTVETAIRTMSRFRKMGIIDIKNGKTVIIDKNRLKEITEDF
ncbi:MAG: Crp/Fnr family transcriptional regulator [Nitrospirota bacterium]